MISSLHGCAGAKIIFTQRVKKEKSCVGFGMPREAIKLEATRHVTDLDNIPGMIVKLAGEHKALVGG